MNGFFAQSNIQHSSERSPFYPFSLSLKTFFRRRPHSYTATTTTASTTFGNGKRIRDDPINRWKKRIDRSVSRHLQTLFSSHCCHFFLLSYRPGIQYSCNEKQGRKNIYRFPAKATHMLLKGQKNQKVETFLWVILRSRENGRRYHFSVAITEGTLP